MKGFQNSFLVHYKMNFLLIFLTDKTSVRMESIYKHTKYDISTVHRKQIHNKE